MKTEILSLPANKQIKMKEFLTHLEFLFDENGQPKNASVVLDWNADGEITITLK